MPAAHQRLPQHRAATAAAAALEAAARCATSRPVTNVLRLEPLQLRPVPLALGARPLVLVLVVCSSALRRWPPAASVAPRFSCTRCWRSCDPIDHRRPGCLPTASSDTSRLIEEAHLPQLLLLLLLLPELVACKLDVLSPGARVKPSKSKLAFKKSMVARQRTARGTPPSTQPSCPSADHSCQVSLLCFQPHAFSSHSTAEKLGVSRATLRTAASERARHRRNGMGPCEPYMTSHGHAPARVIVRRYPDQRQLRGAAG
jgi:hypothetical protein